MVTRSSTAPAGGRYCIGNGGNMANGRMERLAPLAGVVLTVVFAIGFLGSGETPSTSASGAKVIAHYKDNSSMFVGIFGMLIGAVMLMLFAGVLRSRLRAGGPEWLGSVVLGGAAIYSTALGIFAMGQIALRD